MKYNYLPYEYPYANEMLISYEYIITSKSIKYIPIGSTRRKHTFKISIVFLGSARTTLGRLSHYHVVSIMFTQIDGPYILLYRRIQYIIMPLYILILLNVQGGLNLEWFAGYLLIYKLPLHYRHRACAFQKKIYCFTLSHIFKTKKLCRDFCVLTLRIIIICRYSMQWKRVTNTNIW